MDDNKDSLNEIPFSSQRTWMKSHSVQWLTGLEPNSHTKDEVLKAVTMTVSHVSHSKQDKWQKWRKYVLRHKQTLVSSSWMPLYMFSSMRSFFSLLPFKRRPPGITFTSFDLDCSDRLVVANQNVHAYDSSSSSRHRIANQDAHAFDLSCFNRLMLCQSERSRAWSELSYSAGFLPTCTLTRLVWAPFLPGRRWGWSYPNPGWTLPSGGVPLLVSLFRNLLFLGFLGLFPLWPSTSRVTLHGNFWRASHEWSQE